MGVADDDRSRADAQMLVCFRDARARRERDGIGDHDEPLATLCARVQAIVDDFAREAAALGRLVEAGIPFDSHTLPPSTQVAQV